MMPKFGTKKLVYKNYLLAMFVLVAAVGNLDGLYSL